MDRSWEFIWTPPRHDYTQIGVQFNCTPNQVLATWVPVFTCNLPVYFMVPYSHDQATA
jgi:hypothetical protein